MKTLRRLIYSDVIASVAFVTLGFLALFFFFDFVEELPDIGRGVPGAYTLAHALAAVALLIPNHLYELLPITVLIGTIFVMARLAQNSEYTILRTSGLGPARALRVLLTLGLGFTLLTFAIGDYLAPWADRSAQLLKSRQVGGITVGQTGAWIKERQGERSVTVNVAALAPDGSMRGVRVFEFNAQGALVAQIHAARGRFEGSDAWLLEDAHIRRFPARDSAAPATIPVTTPAATAATVPTPRDGLAQEQLAQYRWATSVTAEMVSVALLKPQRMGTIDLFQYIRHLQANGQTSQRYEIEFWRKVFYPLSCLVMVVMALPFAYLHFRSTTIAMLVFGGVLMGISFFLLNNVFGYIGNLRNWQPWLAAAVPGLLYSLLSLGAFGWLVLRR